MAQVINYTLQQKHEIENNINEAINKIVEGYNLKNIIDGMYFQIKKLIDAKYKYEDIVALINKSKSSEKQNITMSNFTKWFGKVNSERNSERDECIAKRQKEIVTELFDKIKESLIKKIKIEDIVERLNLHEVEKAISIDNRFTVKSFEKIYDSVKVEKQQSSSSSK